MQHYTHTQAGVHRALLRNISTVKGSQSFFRKSLEKLHSNHKCPLCMRGFEDKSSLDSTIKTVGEGVMG